MDKDAMLAKVETLYQGRTSGDTSLFSEVLAEGATFEYVGEESLIAAFPGGRTNAPAEVAQALFEQIDMLDRKPLRTFASDDELVVLWDTTLRVKGREPFQQKLFDIWTFDSDDKICAGQQYQDTAKIIAEMQAAGFEN